MSICRRCHNLFSTEARNRVNCYIGAPGKQKALFPSGTDILLCSVCGKSYIWKSHQSTKTRCASCLVNERRILLKLRMVAYKGGHCQICGYKKSMSALTFHHLDPSTKDFEISGSHCRSWSVILKELNKCVLLCRNCHAEIEEGITQL